MRKCLKKFVAMKEKHYLCSVKYVVLNNIKHFQQ